MQLCATGGSGRQRGAVLLEVVLALVLFTGAAVVIGAALRASVQAVERLKLNTHAANLAVSVISELELGIRPLESTGSEPFEMPFENWNYELQLAAASDWPEADEPLIQVEVSVRHAESGVVFRLVQFLRRPEPILLDETEMIARVAASPGGGR